jgi:hypothetical protein
MNWGGYWSKQFAEENKKTLIGFEVLTAVPVKSPIFSDMMLCSPLKVNWLTFNTLHSIIFQETGFFIKCLAQENCSPGLEPHTSKTQSTNVTTTPCSPLEVDWLTFIRLQSIIFQKTGLFVKSLAHENCSPGLEPQTSKTWSKNVNHYKVTFSPDICLEDLRKSSKNISHLTFVHLLPFLR